MNTEKYIAIEGQAKNYEEAITLCGKQLMKEGFVKEGFSESCIAREKEYPTGLCTDIPVAIPHCKSETILKDGICYLRLAEPINFYRMDDDQETVSTRSIFNIAIQSSGDHLDFLQQIMAVVSDNALMEKLESVDIQEVPQLLQKYMTKEAAV